MRRFDKKYHIEKLNKRLNENKFSWDGQYEDEKIDEMTIGLGNDLEFVDDEVEESCGCELKKESLEDEIQWFSDEEGERLIDKDLNS